MLPESQQRLSAYKGYSYIELMECATDGSGMICSRPWAGESAGKSRGHVCHLLECKRIASLIEAIEETVKVLEETRNAFKSKIMGKLRSKLEDVPQKKSKPAAGIAGL